MELNRALGLALRDIRTQSGISQEMMGASQSYVSDIERGMKSVSVEKLDEFSKAIGVHPLTILLKCYAIKDGLSDDALLEKIRSEI